MVDEMTRLSDEVRQIDIRLNSPELQGANYEEFSSQEDKLKVRLINIKTFCFDLLAAHV